MNVPPEAVTAAAGALHDEYCCDGETSTCGRWNPQLPGGDEARRHVDYYEDCAREMLEAAAPLIAAAERERIRLLLLACRKCDRIHEPHPAISHLTATRPFEYQSWAAADGHACQAPHLGRAEIAILLADPAPPIPAEGTTP